MKNKCREKQSRLRLREGVCTADQLTKTSEAHFQWCLATLHPTATLIKRLRLQLTDTRQIPLGTYARWQPSQLDGV